MRHLMSPLDFSVEELDKLLNLADDIGKNPKKYAHTCDDKRLATLFYEPSTRTRLSFEAAMMNLGGKVLGFSSADSSSASKGESVADTIRVVSCYADICAMRHPKEGAPLVASMSSNIPVINAGDGGHQHPTQTLLDLYTIKKELGQIDNLKIALVGDLKFGRTVHSLSNALGLYDNVELYFVAPKELRMPQEVLHDLNKKNIPYTEVDSIEEIIDKVDVLYVTRIQKERFGDLDEYLKIKGAYIVNKKMLEGKDVIVMHPLPRIDEIATDLDNTKHNKYFNQAFNAVPVRMAILKTLIKNNPKWNHIE